MKAAYPANFPGQESGAATHKICGRVRDKLRGLRRAVKDAKPPIRKLTQHFVNQFSGDVVEVCFKRNNAPVDLAQNDGSTFHLKLSAV